ncbi:MAG TPA: hypothetical protein VKG25_17855 [Bryobacteraceae bacterium]|nr:hypothetical protein [Bryobacteraceae bacterium]
MPRPPISNLPKAQRQSLLDDLNYLNMAEIKSFCKRHSIPHAIAMKTKDGRTRRTGEDDRKGVILERIRHFLQTGVVLEQTRFPSSVVCFEPLPENLAAGDSLFYGQYDQTNRSMIALLKDLTDGKFKNGAIARILARDFWASGRAPTFREYAAAWLRAAAEHTRPNPEWAFLSDRAARTAPLNWKQLRADKAAKVIETLNEIIL